MHLEIMETEVSVAGLEDDDDDEGIVCMFLSLSIELEEE